MLLNILLSHSRLLKVIENGTIRKLVYGFLFAFHSNYGSVLFKVRYSSKIAIIHTPAFDAPVRGPRRNIATLIGVGVETLNGVG